MPVFPDAAKRLMARPVTIDGNTLDPTLRLLFATQKLLGEEGLTAGEDPVACRKRFREVLHAMDRKTVPVGGVEEFSIPGPAGPVPVRHYRPDDGDGGPLLVYFHGGGWVLGDLDSYDQPCRALCRGAGVHVLSVDYRLAPEHPAPAGQEDGYAAYRWALEHGAELGANADVVAIGGDSAGGNMSAVLAQRARDDGIQPALQLLIYPATDLSKLTRSRRLFAEGFLLTQRDMDWFQREYLDGSALTATNPRVSPLLAEDLTGLPRALVITAGFDPLRDEGEAYAAAMRAAGVLVDYREMSTLTHGFFNLAPLGGGCAAAFAEMISALRAHLCYR